MVHTLSWLANEELSEQLAEHQSETSAAAKEGGPDSGRGARTPPSATTTLCTTAGECTLPRLALRASPIALCVCSRAPPVRRADSLHCCSAAPGGRCWLSDWRRQHDPHTSASISRCSLAAAPLSTPPTAAAAPALVLRSPCARAASPQDMLAPASVALPHSRTAAAAPP